MTDDPQAEATLVEGPQTVSHNANELRRKLATAERIRENADFHLGQEMARRQLAEKETARLRAQLAAIPAPASTAPLAAGLPLVQGRCPACGTAGLFLGSGGYVTCSTADCPELDAATTVLEGGANWPAVRAALLAEAIARVEDPEERAKTTTGLGLGWEAARDVLRRMADEAQQPTSLAETIAAKREEPAFVQLAEAWSTSGGLIDDGPPAPLRRAWDDCPGFPEQCPNLRPVDPDPPTHLGGIRCGCADKESTS